MTTIKTITVREQIDPSGIGDSTGSDLDWQETVRAACADGIESYLAARFEVAEIDVEVTIGSPGVSKLSVFVDDEFARDDLVRDVRDASERAFDRAC